MAFAPHINNDVRHQLRMGLTPTPAPMILGSFSKGNAGVYEYAERRWHSDTFAPDFPHIVYVGNGETRLAKVLKTVAYVVVDEAADGSPVIEKWPLRSHRPYNTAWVRA